MAGTDPGFQEGTLCQCSVRDSERVRSAVPSQTSRGMIRRKSLQPTAKGTPPTFAFAGDAVPLNIPSASIFWQPFRF